MHKIQFIIFLTLFFCKEVKAQLPSNDSAWVLQTSLSDEFSGSSVDSSLTKWYKGYPSNYFTTSNGYDVSLSNGAELNFSSNLLVSSGTLKIKADTLNPNITVTDTSKLVYGYSVSQTNPNDYKHPLTFAYQGGAIMSRSTNYKFGYLEIYAKYPSKKFSLWPAFWIQNQGCGTSRFVNEVDIAESIALQSYQEII